jgi:hypothetical protein
MADLPLARRVARRARTRQEDERLKDNIMLGVAVAWLVVAVILAFAGPK